MPAKIQYLKTVEDLEIPEDWEKEDTLLVHSDKLLSPKLTPTEMGFSKYKGLYPDLGHSNIILLDFSNCINPSNRTQLIFEFLQENSSSKNKIVADFQPFKGEPWRFWWAFSITDQNPWGWPHSYTVETEWRHWFEYDKETSLFEQEPFEESLQDLSISSKLNKLNTTVEYREPEKFEQLLYEEIKDQVFSEYHTPKLLIGNMIKNLNFVDGLDVYLENKHLVYPDLPVCRFVGTETLRRQTIYNALVS